MERLREKAALVLAPVQGHEPALDIEKRLCKESAVGQEYADQTDLVDDDEAMP